MVPAGILRAVALCLVTLGLRGLAAVRCEDNSEQLLPPKPSSLKDMLDFFGMLDKSDLKTNVFDKIENDMKVYLNDNESSKQGIKQNLQEVVNKMSELRKNLVNSDERGSYYSLQTSEDSVAKYATAMINCLPILHSEMWFLYYQTATECLDLGGYKWASGLVGRSANTTQLYAWLTSQNSGVPLLPKDFSGDILNQKTLPALTFASNTGIKLHRGGPLNHAQYGLLFLRPTWNHSNLASAIMFLEEFCRKVEANIFNAKLSGGEYAELPSLCQKVTEGLKPITKHLWPLYSPVSDEEADGDEEVEKSQDVMHKNIYEGKLKTDAFPKYVDWLQKNIPKIISSLEEMTKSSWSDEELSKSITGGPFKYGFVFKEKCEETALWHKLKVVPKTLSSALNKLLECLTPKSTASEASQNQNGDNSDLVPATTKNDELPSTEETKENEKNGQDVKTEGSRMTEPTLPGNAEGSLPADDSISGPSGDPEKAPAAGPSVAPLPVAPAPKSDQQSDVSSTQPIDTPHSPSPPQTETSDAPRENQNVVLEKPTSTQPQPTDSSKESTPSQPGTSDSNEQVAPGSEHGTSGPQSQPSSEGTTDNSDESSTQPPSSPAPATNLRPAPEASASVPKEPSSFASTQSIGCMVTLGLLVSII